MEMRHLRKRLLPAVCHVATARGRQLERRMMLLASRVRRRLQPAWNSARGDRSLSATMRTEWSAMRTVEWLSWVTRPVGHDGGCRL